MSTAERTAARPRLNTSTRKLVLDAYEVACRMQLCLPHRVAFIDGWCVGSCGDGYKHDARLYLASWAIADLRAIERADGDADIETVLWPQPQESERE